MGRQLQTFAEKKNVNEQWLHKLQYLFIVQTSISEPAHFEDEQTQHVARDVSHSLLITLTEALSNTIVVH
jgi:hypothetical protein